MWVCLLNNWGAIWFLDFHLKIFLPSSVWNSAATLSVYRYWNSLCFKLKRMLSYFYPHVISVLQYDPWRSANSAGCFVNCQNLTITSWKFGYSQSCWTCTMIMHIQSAGIVRTVYSNVFKDILEYSGILMEIQPHFNVLN